MYICVLKHLVRANTNGKERNKKSLSFAFGGIISAWLAFALEGLTLIPIPTEIYVRDSGQHYVERFKDDVFYYHSTDSRTVYFIKHLTRVDRIVIFNNVRTYILVKQIRLNIFNKIISEDVSMDSYESIRYVKEHYPELLMEICL